MELAFWDHTPPFFLGLLCQHNHLVQPLPTFCGGKPTFLALDRRCPPNPACINCVQDFSFPSPPPVLANTIFKSVLPHLHFLSTNLHLTSDLMLSTCLLQHSPFLILLLKSFQVKFLLQGMSHWCQPISPIFSKNANICRAFIKPMAFGYHGGLSFSFIFLKIFKNGFLLAV